jgi:predicted amidohydrolase
MLKQIGYFHQGCEIRSDPVQALQKAIDDKGGTVVVADSLIVLPEAFNLTEHYDAATVAHVKPSVEASLKSIALAGRIAFVVGLLRPNCLGRKCSTAYLITGSEPAFLLSQKVHLDSSRDLYEPCDPIDQVKEYGGATIAALICMDFESDNDRRKRIVDCLRNRQCPILCVPTNTNRYRTVSFGADVPEAHVIVANGHSLDASSPGRNDYCPSIIKIKGEPTPRDPFQDRTNVIRLATV